MRLTLIALAAGAVMVAGCAMRPPYSAQMQSKLGEVSDRVYVTSIKEQVLPDGTMKIAAFIESDTRFDQSVKYRVNWFDGNGMPIDTTVSAYEPRLVSGKTAFDFTAVAPGPKAKSYKIDILSEGE